LARNTKKIKIVRTNRQSNLRASCQSFFSLSVGWCGQFLFFVIPRQFSQVIGEWPENQTKPNQQPNLFFVVPHQFSQESQLKTLVTAVVIYPTKLPGKKPFGTLG